jgi:hypothetical protein
LEKIKKPANPARSRRMLIFRKPYIRVGKRENLDQEKGKLVLEAASPAFAHRADKPHCKMTFNIK